MHKNMQKQHSSHTEEAQSVYSNIFHCPYSLDVLLPSFCWSSSCSLGKSTSKVTMSDPRILLLSKFGRPSPFFQIRAPGLVILSLTMCTYKTKRWDSVSLWSVLSVVFSGVLKWGGKALSFFITHFPNNSFPYDT